MSEGGRELLSDRSVRLTGVLLVGGGSERFGSPKALARFRGETLADRGCRTLEEACDEVLVVGKASDGLPFPVLDDGTDSRAPIHGVIAVYMKREDRRHRELVDAIEKHGPPPGWRP